ncbi:beta-phosphoglucomutase family hydrolase [Candidatus Woesearchaeota archaeon]|nr:beta-phosphoglucomutase family hydrolase [Candidatus Woesearchaeota archaeon]
MKCKGAIFDLDGVITSTATAHAQAWKEMFDDYLQKDAEKRDKSFKAFEKEDYLRYVDGKPRYQGAQSFFLSRGIKLPFGDPKDDPEKETVCGLGNKKNVLYNKLLSKHKPHVFPKAVALIKKLRKAGVKTAVASSSKNCKKILTVTGLYGLFDVHVDGNTLQRLGIKGKPEPDMFVHAATQLHAKPGECIVFEDAISGIRAGNRGNFGLVVGVAPYKDMLTGADKVFRRAGDLTLQQVREWFDHGMDKENWLIKYHHYDPELQQTREALTMVGNGHFGTRGCHETQTANDHHYPGCYLANVFNKPKSVVQGKEVWINEMVNCPNWLLVKITIGKKVVDPFKEHITKYEQALDLRHGILKYDMEFKEKNGRITEISSERFASMHDPHTACLKVTVTPQNYDDTIILQSLIDGDVKNENAARYKQFTNKHVIVTATGKTGGKCYLDAKTSTGKYHLGYAMKNHFSLAGRNVQQKTLIKQHTKIGEAVLLKAKQRQPCSIEKTVSIYTSNDVDQPRKRTLSNLKTGHDACKRKHQQAWARLWEKADVAVEGDRYTQRLLRLHAYHLLSIASPHNKRLDAGMPARGLHGESYHGHLFWDELYVQPFFLHRFPDIARALLLYRYRRLEAAKENAKKAGYAGAMYPWQSADTGEEETQPIHYNPVDKSWGPDLSMQQRHVNIAIFYDFFQYVKHTDDAAFLNDYAAEVMVEIARFWTSMATYDAKDKKYHVSGVMGPDEFHEKLPKSGETGLTDNAYTNIMVSWLLRRTFDLRKRIPRRLLQLNVTKEELLEWENISNNLAVHVKQGIIQQFKGYDKLKELNWDRYRKKYGDVGRMDRILKAEKKSPDDYKVAKQADTLMVFYLLKLTDALDVLRRLGIQANHPLRFLKKHYDYYESRTSHGSTLSKLVHDAIITRFHDRRKSWEWFSGAIKSDFADVQGGTTKEGVHTGMMAGTIRIAREDLAGIHLTENGVSVYPLLPKHWEHIKLSLCNKGTLYAFDITHKEVLVSTSGKERTSIDVHGKHYQLTPGKRRRIKL